jgi:hypothetical protein
MEIVVKACQSCQAKHVLLILDCCYSGFAAIRASGPQKPSRMTDDYIKDITSRRAIQVLAAGQEDEAVSDSGIRQGYSAFTGALLNVLETELDIDNDGILTASEIGSDLKDQVALQKAQCYQRPSYNSIVGSRGGDFVFRIFPVSEPDNVVALNEFPEFKIIESIPSNIIPLSYTS